MSERLRTRWSEASDFFGIADIAYIAYKLNLVAKT